MALFEIPTGILQEQIVDALPQTGEENIVYRRLVEDEELREMQITDDFIWYDDEWHPFSFDARIYGAYFERYQQSVADYIAELEARISELEGDETILFIGNNIEIVESWNSIEKTISVATEIELSNPATVKLEMTNMTIDGEPIDDVTDTIQLGNLESWDWKGGECYADVFLPAYFSFGTKPMNGVVNQITLGFTNEQEHFDERTLVIGHIKVEVVNDAPTKKGGKK